MQKRLFYLALSMVFAFVTWGLIPPASAVAQTVKPPLSPGETFEGWRVDAFAPMFITSGMDFSASNNGWALASNRYGLNDARSQGSVYHYDGTRWRWKQSFDEIQLRDVSTLSPTDGNNC